MKIKMKVASSLQTLRLLALLLLTLCCAQLASAQYRQARPAFRAQSSAQAQPAATPAAEAQPTPEPVATPEATIPSTNAENPDAQPAKQSEPLPFTLDEKSDANTEAPSAAGLLVRTLGALLLIVGLIVAAGWGLRRFGGARFGAARKDAPELSVLTSVSLGNRRSIAVVRFGDRNLLIGSTAQTITLLDAEDPETGETKTPVARSVADLLKADEVKEFQEELAEADAQLDDPLIDWQAEGGAA